MLSTKINNFSKNDFEELKTQEEAKVAIPHPLLSDSMMKDYSLIYFGNSKTLRTPTHQKMVFNFVIDQYPLARFQRIYDAAADGWSAVDFHRCCDNKGWTLNIVQTTKDFIFGGFTTAEWESPFPHSIHKPCPNSFLFSVNEGRKHPIRRGDRKAISCHSWCCAQFGDGGWELVISRDSNKNTKSHCNANC